MGLAAQKKITIDDETMIKTSFPQFKNLIQELGANFS
jgi:3-phosphoshikimate 1-carboxyvinyltransferase